MSIPAPGEIWNEHHGANRALVRDVADDAASTVTFVWLPARTNVVEVPLATFVEQMWFAGEHAAA